MSVEQDVNSAVVAFLHRKRDFKDLMKLDLKPIYLSSELPMYRYEEIVASAILNNSTNIVNHDLRALWSNFKLEMNNDAFLKEAENVQRVRYVYGDPDCPRCGLPKTETNSAGPIYDFDVGSTGLTPGQGENYEG